MAGRKCNKCHEFKPWEGFAINSKGVNGRKSVCKTCASKDAKILLEYRKSVDPDAVSAKRRAKFLKRTYGFSEHSYENMLRDQGYKCAICGRPDNGLSNQKQLYVDHCHTNGHVRGLLCYYCNTVLGLAFDNVDILMSAAEYLQKDKDGKT